MVTSDERLKVLTMVQAGKITAEEAVQLLEALDESSAEGKHKTAQQVVPPAYPGRSGRWLQMRVTDTGTGKIRVNVRLPLGVVKSGLKMGMHFVPEAEGLDKEELLTAVEQGSIGKIFDVYDEKDGEHVEVYIE
ncbi:MAG: hypothetical protein LLG42_13230 [Chloroflexi bacterium]|nr:hypothetical protein [Chloroflexota bacterium]